MGMTISQWERRDRREGPRARLTLRLAVVFPQQEGRPYRPVHHGRTHDISMSGLSMLVEDNIYHEGEVTVLLALPPEHNWAAQKIITATAVMTYAIRSSKLNAYKIGLVFREFKADGKELLRAAMRREPQSAADAGAHAPGAGSVADRPTDSEPLTWW